MIIGIALALVAVFGALLGLLWLVTRNPSRDRELKAARAENERYRGLLARLHEKAAGYADVDPVAQVFVDEIRGAGITPAQLKGRNSDG